MDPGFRRGDDSIKLKPTLDIGADRPRLSRSEIGGQAERSA